MKGFIIWHIFTYMTVGVVSFLDVLGWKGIWINHSDSKAIDYLSGFISSFKSTMKVKFPNSNIEIICFSDTLVIFTPNEENFQTSILMHAEICQWALDISLNYNLLLRGVIGYGEYFYSSYPDVIMVGPVIDEVSSWNEKVDWLGVILAPSVLFEAMRHSLTLEDSKFIVNYESIPLKEKINGLELCVRWGYSKTVLLNLIKNQKHTPSEVVPKYLNTLSFFNYLNLPSPNPTDDEFENEEAELYILKTGATLEFGDFFNDILSLSIPEISVDTGEVVVAFNMKDSGMVTSKESILKVGDFRKFESFEIFIRNIFLGTQNSLVEVEVKRYRS